MSSTRPFLGTNDGQLHALDALTCRGQVDLLQVQLRKRHQFPPPEEIRAALMERNPDRITSHQASNLTMVPCEDGTSATATYYLTVYDNQDPSGGVQMKTILRSEDRFTLRNGKWVLAQKRSKKHL